MCNLQGPPPLQSTPSMSAVSVCSRPLSPVGSVLCCLAFTSRRQENSFSTWKANVALKASTENPLVGLVDVELGRVLLLVFRILCNTVGKCSICLVLKSTLELGGKMILSRILREGGGYFGHLYSKSPPSWNASLKLALLIFCVFFRGLPAHKPFQASSKAGSVWGRLSC